LDFGASHQLHRGPWISEFDQEQVAVATPAYASCQILEGEAADARDDIYALACIAYVLLTGRHPYLESTALKARTLKLEPKRPSGLERRQWHALRAGLEFSRERRPADMQAWLAQLDLRAAAPTLPALLSLGTTRGRYSSPFAGSRAPAITGLAGLLIVGAWAAATHFDSIAAAAGALGARFKSMAAGALSSPVWDKGLPIGGHPDPVIQPPPGSDEVGVSIDSTASTHSAGHGPVVAPPAPSNRSGSAAHLPGAERGRSPVAPEPPAVHPQAAARSATDTPGRPPASASLVARAAVPMIPSSASPSGIGSSESPHSRIELAADSVEVAPGEPMAHIVVRRRGNLRGDASFSWWTESGTAKPGRDFVPVKTQIEHIDNGQSALSLIIPVVKDPAQRESRSFYVVIDQPSENATLGRTLTMVTIPGSDPSQPSADQ
jgi:serine/threonine protein kinase